MKKTMTTLMVLAVICLASLAANAAVYVRGYSRSNGTYVQPHYRSSPDGSRSNNWSTRGNVNPYTGKRGTRRLSTMDNFGVPSYERPSTLPSYSPNIPGDGSWSKPSPLPGPTFPENGIGHVSVLSN